MIDLDNTLGDRQRAVHAWIDQFVIDRQLDDDAAAWIRTLDNDGYSSRIEVLTALRERFDLVDSVDDLLASYQDRIIELTEPVDGAHECLAGLRDHGWQIAIVTNGSTKQQNAKIDHLGFRSMVDAVVVSETLGIKKPERGIFDAAAGVCGVALDELGTGEHWMIGDSPLHDIIGAQRIGLSTAWMPRGRRWSADQPAPTIEIDALDRLPGELAARR